MQLKLKFQHFQITFVSRSCYKYNVEVLRISTSYLCSLDEVVFALFGQVIGTFLEEDLGLPRSYES